MSWLPKKKVLVPIDFSESSERALLTALELVEDPADVTVVHVLFPLDSVSPGVVWGNVDNEHRTTAVRASFDKLFAKLNATIPNVEVLVGNPGLKITEYASKIAADLIVIPSHGRHGVERLLLGSVAERVIRHAPCPLLVLRRNPNS